ncbi:energy-coupling factor transport system ATP-binding protein [Thermosyntropha lipolytica DSM 11003]|uniref:Energy-coupling factor transport system ATP-binding protein n=1 Tax=Thermosyntropha lipolytica DSM 11003 TaxID=1123382 RepID=A0A1M5MDA6_9FIRM|nr:ATP-binding cassette domain-containing protein [Thermosyntropha lipolytica]SHG75206.1 energy-coupling factor transport system ATP-binding protein [Thermosyntropha lipolytica DSM 11003]
MIEFIDVGYRYAENAEWVFNKVSFNIEKGDFVGIVGKNGSGKSTLARMFNGLLLPTCGKVLVDGWDTRSASRLYDIRRKVGLLLPHPDHQIVASVVEDDVAFGPANLGLDSREIRQRVDEALKLVEMEEFKKHPPYLLSGGQKQRVALAGILALKPDYLVLDEPTSMLEPAGQKEVVRILQKINRESGVALIWITHNLEEIIHAERIMVLQEGSLNEYRNIKLLLLKTELWQKAGIEPLSYACMTELLGLKESLPLPSDFTAEEMVDNLCRYYWKR